MTVQNNKVTLPSTFLVGEGDKLNETCTKIYFGHLCVAFTTCNSLEYYPASPWNFAIQDNDGWHYYYFNIPNKAKTRAQALRRAWHRAKWMHDGTYEEHYKDMIT